MFVKGFFDNDTNTITYVVADTETHEAAIIDPVWDYSPNDGKLRTTSIDAILSYVEAEGFKLVRVLDTHAHADHLSSADYVRRKMGVPYGIGAEITTVQSVFKPRFNATDLLTDGHDFDDLFKEGEEFSIGNLKVRVLHTPGHTPACLTYVIGDAAFVGDTLFMPDYGTARADFPGGDAATLYQSIQKILSLPEDTRIFVGHDYLPEGRTEYVWETTVANQKKSNKHVHDGISENEFVAMRTKRDATLSAPRLILPSLQVNIRGGALPPKDDDGKTYIKIPVNQL